MLGLCGVGPTRAHVELQVLRDGADGAEVGAVVEMLLHRIGRNLPKFIFHSFADAHGVHGDTCTRRRASPRSCRDLRQAQPPRLRGGPGHPASPASLAFLAYSVMSSCERPSVKTSPIRGTLCLEGRAPSASEKLFSSMCLRARPVMVPFSMYST